MSQASGTRKRTQAGPPAGLHRSLDNSSSQSSSGTERNLPPPRHTPGIRRDISLPFQKTRLTRLIYVLVTLTTLLTAFYAYRTIQHKREVGGWWNLLTGRGPMPVAYHDAGNVHHAEPTDSKGSEGGHWYQKDKDSHSVEDKINDLAYALGMPSRELASAIAIAVREYVPPASLSSVAAKETGSIAQVLVHGATDDEEGKFAKITQGGANEPEATQGVFESVIHGVNDFVGMEEP